ncbi:MAG: hypothetical protein E7290_09375 [Lachnospiraceae bacterium]|nr:hypothetical protein [Lachnospiraceae bacterium]
MIKAELRKLRALNATKEMMQKAAADNGVEAKEKDGNGKPYTKKYKYRYGMYLRCQNLNGYLKIAVFLPDDMKKGIETPRFEIFINPKADEYITREYENGEEKWRKATIENLNFPKGIWSYLYYDCFKESWINKDGAKSIKTVLKVEDGGYIGIRDYQRKVLKEKREEQYRRETAAWDADMALVKDLPKNFMEWVSKKGIPEHFIFYQYDAKKEAESGYCSYCDKDVPIVKPRHNKKGVCACCKNKITFKATGKVKTLKTEKYDCALIQRIEGGFVIRTFEAYRYIARNGDLMCSLYEFRRVLYRENTSMQYTMGLYKNKEYRWIREVHKVYGHKVRVYPYNISQLSKTVLKHSALHIMIRHNPKLNVERYLYVEQGNPAIEKLAKIGMIRLAKEMMDYHYDSKLLNEEETDLAKLLKLDKNRLNRLKDMHGGIKGLRWFQTEKQQNTIYRDEMIHYFMLRDLEPSDFDFISKYMTYQKIWNYLKRQQELTNDTAEQLVKTWQDYLNMAVKAKMPVNVEQIYKPKDLKQKHAEVIEILQQESFKEKAVKVRERFKDVDMVCAELTKYEYDGEKYCIVAPSGVEDIIREGTILQHCVHTCDFYWDRICRRETYLLFLRRTTSKDTPYYTLEVEPTGNIRQKRTTGDNQNKDFDEAIGFLKKWQKEIQKRLSKEDKALGEKSNILRKKEYEKLRKDGNKVWHGKLAGKLLVDVLEEDFMEVI